MCQPGNDRDKNRERETMQALMTVPEVAQTLGIAAKTVYQNWRTWGLTPVRIGGGTAGPIRFRVADVERLVSEWGRQ